MYALPWRGVFHGVWIMSVQAPGSNMMMRSQKTEGSAESGRGVVMAGFYVSNADVSKRLQETDIAHGPFTEISLFESEGWTAFIGCSEEPLPVKTRALKVGHFRREAHKFFEDLPKYLFQSRAVHVHRLNLSQSSGFLSLTWLYSDDEPGV